MGWPVLEPGVEPVPFKPQVCSWMEKNWNLCQEPHRKAHYQCYTLVIHQISKTAQVPLKGSLQGSPPLIQAPPEL